MVTILAALTSDRSFSLTFNLRVHDPRIFILFSEHRFVMQIHFFRLLPRRCLRCTMRCRKPDPFDALSWRMNYLVPSSTADLHITKPKIRVLTKSMQSDARFGVLRDMPHSLSVSMIRVYITVSIQPRAW